MSRRKTITRNELVGLAREKRSALGMNRGQSRDESIGGDESNIDVVNRQHLLSQALSRGKSVVLNPNHSQTCEPNTQRKEHGATNATTMDHHVDVEVHSQAPHDEYESSNSQTRVGTCVDKNRQQRRKRGFTYVPHLWAISSNQPGYKPKEIEFDQHDKPIGPNKSDFVEFLGSIARNGQLAPLSYRKWTDISKEEKEAMLVHVKGIFVVPVGYDERILQAIGKSWKTYKSRIKAKYYDKNLSKEQNMRNRPNTRDEDRDERVSEEHWRCLVDYWSSSKAQEISEQNKTNRAHKKMQHITGKRSFAQVYDIETEAMHENIEKVFGETGEYDPVDVELSRATIFEKCYSKDGNTSNPLVAHALQKMEDLRSQLPPGTRDIGKDDIYSQVLGEDKGGRVRIYGTTSSRIYGEKHDQNDIQRMNKENAAMKKRVEEQDKLIQMLLRNEEIRGNTSSEIRKAHSPPISDNSDQANLHEVSTFSSSVKVGMRVTLKSMVNFGKSIAKGFVESINPSKLVGNEELGENWCEVRIIVPIEPQEQLIRSIGGVKMVGQAIGRCIAWPTHLVVDEKSR